MTSINVILSSGDDDSLQNVGQNYVVCSQPKNMDLNQENNSTAMNDSKPDHDQQTKWRCRKDYFSWNIEGLTQLVGTQLSYLDLTRIFDIIFNNDIFTFQDNSVEARRGHNIQTPTHLNDMMETNLQYNFHDEIHIGHISDDGTR